MVDKSYTGAPYNFVDFPSQWVARYERMEDLPKHDRYESDRLTGQIDFEWEALTSVCVGSGRDGSNVHFFKNTLGYAIPGSSVRGLLRSHIQILGMGNYREDIDDQLFLYRNVAGKPKELNEQYRASIGAASTSKTNSQREMRNNLPDKLKAGYVEYKRGENGNSFFQITPAQEDGHGKQFYRLSEQKLREWHAERIQGISFMYTSSVWDQLIRKDSEEAKQLLRGINEMDNKKAQKLLEKEIERLNKKKLRDHYNRNYSPYVAEIFFALDDKGEKVKKISSPQKEKTNGMIPGYLLSSGYIGGKRAHYVVREMDENAPKIKINKDEQFKYENDLRQSKIQNSFYKLPTKETERKPIFYVENPERIYFGFTPYLRVSYDHSVRDGMPSEFRQGWKLDYEKSLFGFINNYDSKSGISYKSRLSFTDLQALGTPVEEKMGIPVTLAEPKATAYPLYIKQPDAEKGKLYTYNETNFELRGMKKYWPKYQKRSEAPNTLKITVKTEATDKPKMNTQLHALPAGTRFRGSVHFTNLEADELGLLCWALLLDEQSVFQIGMGKPYGLGSMKIDRSSVKLRVEDLPVKYGNVIALFEDYMVNSDPMKYIKVYKDYLLTEKKIDISKETCVQDLFKMLNSPMLLEKTRYMTIQQKEFQALNPLSTISETLAGKARFYRPKDDHSNSRSRNIRNQPNNNVYHRSNNSSTYDQHSVHRDNKASKKYHSQDGDDISNNPFAKLKDIDFSKDKKN